MIIRKKENWFRMLFIWRGDVLPQLIPRLSILLILSIGIVWFQDVIVKYKLHLNPAPFTLFGIALALFLGFRNSASYDRFWEGRKLWGSLINTTRSLTRQVLTLPLQTRDVKETSLFVNYLIAIAYVTKHQLRGTDPAADMDRLLPASLSIRVKAARYKPHLLIRELGHWIQSARLRGNIDTIAQQSFDSNLNLLSDIVGGCERVASTPIPYSYNVLLHRTVYIYCFFLPLGLVDSLGWMTPVIVVFIAYTYVALEAIADELENPFGLHPNDIALDAICRTLENSLLELDNRPILPDSQSGDTLIIT
ncbi:bestrophin family protein [Puia sp.]|jgi:putative membrane protein|uniref:bestrophin family protein n=1 Tax=Puia sp. TaxID=2045100 RepID=UPI002F400D65